MPTRIGRTTLTSAVIVPGVATGSAYNAGDAIGSAFEIPVALGDPGGLVAQLNAFDRGTANAALRVHFFSTPASAVANGDPFTIARADEPNYLGYIDVNAAAWVSAGTNLMQARVLDQNVGLYATGLTRSIYAQVATPAAPTFGSTANPLSLNLVVLQD